MSDGRLPQLKLSLLRALLIAALPSACAVGVQPDMTDEGASGDSGSTAGGSSSTTLAGMSGSAPKAGTSSTGGSVTNAFGGTASSGGKAGSSSGAGADAGGAGGSGKGGSGGSSGGGGAGGSGAGSAGSSGSGGAGGGTGTCACPKTLAWVDNTSINWSSGDCLSLGGKTYLYTGTRMQTYANSQCNPTKQETWCTDSGNDYKFMACN